MNKEDFGALFQQGTAIRKQTVAFITSMIKPRGGVKHLRKQKSWTDEVWERYERITGNERPELFRTKREAE